MSANTAVTYWLMHTIKLSQYTTTFYNDGFETLEDINLIRNHSDLKEMGINKLAHRMKIMQYIQTTNNERAQSVPNMTMTSSTPRTQHVPRSSSVPVPASFHHINTGPQSSQSNEPIPPNVTNNNTHSPSLPLPNLTLLSSQTIPPNIPNQTILPNISNQTIPTLLLANLSRTPMTSTGTPSQNLLSFRFRF